MSKFYEGFKYFRVKFLYLKHEASWSLMVKFKIMFNYLTFQPIVHLHDLLTGMTLLRLGPLLRDFTNAISIKYINFIY